VCVTRPSAHLFDLISELVLLFNCLYLVAANWHISSTLQTERSIPFIIFTFLYRDLVPYNYVVTEHTANYVVTEHTAALSSYRQTET